jgi:hypothetical protein
MAQYNSFNPDFELARLRQESFRGERAAERQACEAAGQEVAGAGLAGRWISRVATLATRCQRTRLAPASTQ